MSIASRLEKLERRTPARKVPRNDEDLAAWAIDQLFHSTPRTDEPVRDGGPSPFLIFLKMVRSGEIEREVERRRGLSKPAELEDRVSDEVVRET
jgi:hypothetical protein